jgi:cobalt-zinc-cadmium efflux system outer membrane protein
MLPAITLAAVVTAQVFQQLPLPLALVDGVANSPDVLQAQERVRENQALLAIARAAVFPQAQFNYAQVPQGGPSNTILSQRLTTVGGSITLGDVLAYEPAVRQAEATLQGAQFDLLAAQRTERATVTKFYYMALRAIATEHLRLQLMTQAQSGERTAQQRFTAGDAPRLDVIRARVASAQAQADLDQARVERANAVEALSIETGLPVAALRTLEPNHAATAPAMPVLSSDPQQAVALALHTRGDVASAQAAVEAATAAVQVAARGVLPAVVVSAGYTGGTDSGVLVHGPSANVTASLPLSNVAHDRIEAERARLAQAQAKRESIRRQVTLDVGAAARAYSASEAATQAATSARTAAEAELRATETGYRSGASSSLDVADAQRTYVQAAIEELDAIYAQAQARATLEEEIGL